MNAYEKQKHLDRMLYLLDLTISNKRTYRDDLSVFTLLNIYLKFA